MKKICSFGGCNKVVDHPGDKSSPRCPDHQVVRPKRKEYDHHLDEQGRNIYHTPRWRKLRGYKKKLNPLCERCLQHGKATAMREVDHKVAIEDGGPIWEFSNLQSLCARCHRIKTNEEKAARERRDGAGGFFI